MTTACSARVFAYCRVSTPDQTTANQLQEIAGAGFEVSPWRAITETISGSVAASERPGWASLVAKLEQGDILVVTKLDRLGRNAMDVRATVDWLAEQAVRVYCLALGGMDLTSSAGRMTMQVVNAVAEFERDLLIERTQAGLSRAKAGGKSLGRPKSLSPEESKEVLKMLNQGQSVAGVARQLGTSRQTIMRVRDALKSH